MKRKLQLCIFLVLDTSSDFFNIFRKNNILIKLMKKKSINLKIII